ncbi:MAG: hypothetical protein ABSD56_09610, partial [Bryobacteraceae bacterium]
DVVVSLLEAHGAVSAPVEFRAGVARKVITPYSGTDASWRLKYPPPILTLEPTGRTGSDVSGWLHDFTPMVSIGVTF